MLKHPNRTITHNRMKLNQDLKRNEITKKFGEQRKIKLTDICDDTIRYTMIFVVTTLGETQRLFFEQIGIERGSYVILTLYLSLFIWCDVAHSCVSSWVNFRTRKKEDLINKKNKTNLSNKININHVTILRYHFVLVIMLLM